MAKDRCPKCGVKRSPGYNLCFTCGYRFFGESKVKIRPREGLHEKMFPPISDLLQSEGTSTKKVKCPQCEEEIPTGAKFCVKCGKKIVEKQTSSQEEIEELKNCSNCGEEILEGAKFCFTCGKKIEKMYVDPSIVEEKEEILVKNCPKCGEQLLEGAKYCFKCGIEVGEVDSKLSKTDISKDQPDTITQAELESLAPIAEIKKEEPETITQTELEPLDVIAEIRNDEPETTVPLKPKFTYDFSESSQEESNIIDEENLTPIPVSKVKRESKLKPTFCEFCGMRLPKKTTFCLQCGMIIKN